MAAGLIKQIDNFSAEQAREAFGSLSGSAHASASQVASALGRNFSATLARRTSFSLAAPPSSSALASTQVASLDASRFGPLTVMSDAQVAQAGPARGVETPLPSAQERGLWMQALGSGGHVDSDGNGSGWRYHSNGFTLGYDQPVHEGWLAGAALGYSRSSWNATSGDPANGDIDSPQAGLYARYASEAWRARFDATYADHDFSTDRTITIGGARSNADSSHGGHEWGLSAQVEAPMPMGDWELRPLMGLRHARLDESGFTETGRRRRRPRGGRSHHAEHLVLRPACASCGSSTRARAGWNCARWPRTCSATTTRR
jgi:outer membrane autotransporter protein